MNKIDDSGKQMDETEETELKAPQQDVRIDNVFVGKEDGKSSGETILSFNEDGVSPGLASIGVEAQSRIVPQSFASGRAVIATSV